MRTVILPRPPRAAIAAPIAIRAPGHPAAWAPVGIALGLAIAKAIDVAVGGPGLLAAFGL